MKFWLSLSIIIECINFSLFIFFFLFRFCCATLWLVRFSGIRDLNFNPWHLKTWCQIWMNLLELQKRLICFVTKRMMILTLRKIWKSKEPYWFVVKWWVSFWCFESQLCCYLENAWIIYIWDFFREMKYGNFWAVKKLFSWHLLNNFWRIHNFQKNFIPMHRTVLRKKLFPCFFREINCLVTSLVKTWFDGKTVNFSAKIVMHTIRVTKGNIPENKD